MPETPSILASLAARAAAEPESPFLFWQAAWDWKWWSWQRTAELTWQWADALASLPPGASVGYAGDVFPQAVALDLAIQRAGLVPLPLAAHPWPGSEAIAAQLRDLECVAWLEATVEGDLQVRGVPVPSHVGPSHAPSAVRPDSLESAVQDIERIVEVAGRVGEREIAFAGRSLGDPAGRQSLAWAVANGAVLATEGDAERRPAAILWTRPTLLFGTRQEIVELDRNLAARQAASWARRWRKPLRRLRVILQQEEPAPVEIAAWAARGVRLHPLPH